MYQNFYWRMIILRKSKAKESTRTKVKNPKLIFSSFVVSTKMNVLFACITELDTSHPLAQGG